MSSDGDKQQNDSKGADSALNVIRGKINALYKEEPDAKEEVVEATEAGGHRSKHQKYMYELSTSGKPLAEIQTAWHNYYVNLPDNEKHEVWQEFYEAHGQGQNTAAAMPAAELGEPKPKEPRVYHQDSPHVGGTEQSTKKKLLGKVTAQGKISKKQHLKSLIFGLSMGSIVVLILLFGFFNERFIAPFISPSKNVSTTPIIIDPVSTQAGPDPEVIIPKINVEVPVVYDVTVTDEHQVQAALERGVVHYPTTPNPGQKGNVAIVGHSSNNIFNKGKYKFAFVLLSKLEEGDLFYLTKDGTRYAYRVYEKRIVAPDDVSVLGEASKPSTATLITCDPPGTSLHRLVVVGEQISPDPANNTKSTAITTDATPSIVPGNAQSLWSRLVDWVLRRN